MAIGKIELTFLRDNLLFYDKVREEQGRQLEELITVLFFSKVKFFRVVQRTVLALFLVKVDKAFG
ncbi:MAG TPA: hypothetical protein GXZ31_05805 [Thermoanaerobacterales bacterium]|nr:hypothetical protein [Thermoanaerobacterales bacterium]